MLNLIKFAYCIVDLLVIRQVKTVYLIDKFVVLGKICGERLAEDEKGVDHIQHKPITSCRHIGVILHFLKI